MQTEALARPLAGGSDCALHHTSSEPSNELSSMHREAVEANMSSILTQYASFQETGVITDDETASIASLCTELSSYRVQRLCGVVRRLVPEEVIETTKAGL